MQAISAALGFCSAVLGFLIVGTILLKSFLPERVELSRAERFVAAFGLGNGAVVLEMFMFILGDVPLTPLNLGMPWIVIGGICLYRWVKRAPLRFPWRRFDRSFAETFQRLTGSRRSWGFLEACVGASIVLAVVDLLARVLTTPFLYGDALWFWTPKAKIFYEHRLVPFAGFRDIGEFFHADYPLFVPLSEAWLFLWMGEANEYFMKLLFPVYAMFLFLGIWAFTERLCGRQAGWIATGLLATTPIVLRQAADGLADLPLAFCYWITSALLLRWVATDRLPLLALSAVFLGLAGWIKNEGAPLIVLNTCILALSLVMRRKSGTVANVGKILLFGGIAVSVLSPWLFLRFHLGLESDLVMPPFAMLLPLALQRLWPVLKDLAVELFSPSHTVLSWNLAWYLLAAVLAVHGRALWRSPFRYAALLVVGQVSIYLAVYLITPHDVGWQVRTSLDRLLLHLYPLVALLVGWGLSGDAKGPTEVSPS